MFWTLLKQSYLRHRRRKGLAVLTVMLAAAQITALLTVSIDVGDKMAKEMKSYGANILVEPAGTGLSLNIGGVQLNPLAGKQTLRQDELPYIKEIFWRNNIVGFAPLLYGKVALADQRLPLLGTFFDQPLPVDGDPAYRTGQQYISPYWQVRGAWPDDDQPQLLAGAQLAARYGWQPGQSLTLQGPAEPLTLTLSGILTTGGEEEQQLIAPLAVAQQLLAMPGQISAVRVSALTVPENALSRKARQDPESLTAEEYDLWFCTAYVSTIAAQIEDAIAGAAVKPIWQVASAEGAVIRKIQQLLLVVTLAAFVAAGMGIASLMTSTILERAKEIGLMKSLGAREWQIHLLFYAEAAVSGVFGGLLGCGMGAALAWLIGLALFGEPLSFSWIVLPLVVVLSVLIALLGCFGPARRISRLYPVEVLYGRH